MIYTRKQLKDYCLRRLGSPVINIEVDDTQVDDRIDDALDFFISRHFGGSNEQMLKVYIPTDYYAKGYLQLPEEIQAVLEVATINHQNVDRLDNIELRYFEDVFGTGGLMPMAGGMAYYYMSQSYLNLLRYIFNEYTTSFTFNPVTKKFYPKFNVTPFTGNVIPSKDQKDFVTDWTAINSTVVNDNAPDAAGNNIAATATAIANGAFGLSYTYTTDGYVIGRYIAGMNVQAGTYVGDVTLRVKDRAGNIISETTKYVDDQWTTIYVEAEFLPEHRQDIVLELVTASTALAGQTINFYKPIISRQNFIVLRAYQQVDLDLDDGIYNDAWLKRYATALIKRQWGENLRKYDQIQLPSGVTIQGQQILDEAIQEIDKLEIEFQQRYEEPDLFFIG